MKKLKLIFFTLVAFCIQTNLSAQNQTTTPPSDAPSGYTYDFDLAKKIIIDRQLKPSNSNQVAQPIIDAKDFPKLKGQNDLNASYNDKLKEWMEKNPSLIIESLKSKNEIVKPY